MIEFVKDSFEFIPQEPGLEGAYKLAELAARTCYKSENLIKEGSAHHIVDDICIKNGHTSVTEFATLYMKVGVWHPKVIWKYLFKDKYSRVRFQGLYAYITTTLRTLLQGDYTDPADAIKNDYDKDWVEDYKKYMCIEPTKYHHQRYCYKFVMDRVGGESVGRHRGVAIAPGVSRAQESTRYCNYNGKKFGGTIKVCIPSKFYELVDDWSRCGDIKTGESYEWLKDAFLDEQLDFLYKNDESWKVYVDGLEKDAETYNKLIESGWKPEDARGVLPLDLKTEFMMCSWKETWRMFLFRRDDSHAHPHIQKIAKALKEDMKLRGII